MRRYSACSVLVLFAGVVGVAGCRREAPTRPDDLAAPETLEELVPWAYQQLITPLEPEPVPQPSFSAPTAAPSSASVTNAPLRLTALLRSAEMQSNWSAPEQPAEALLTIRDRSFAQPGANAQAGVRRFVGGRDYKRLALTDFSVDGGQVGRLQLRANFGQARQFNLTWSEAGTISWPISKPGQTTTYDISTEKLSDWNQRISTLSVAVPDLEGNDIIVEELRLLPQESAYPEPVGWRRVMLQAQLREVIYAHHPSAITYRGVSLPENGRFECGLAVTGAPWGRFRLALGSGAQQKVLVEREINQVDTWVEVNVGLGEWAGRRADLVLSTEGPAGGVGCWSDPQFYRPVTNPRRVLVYLIDTLGAAHMSLYGYHRQTTPNLEALAARGTWFANVFSNASRTVESIPNIMLSMPTISHGVRNEFSAVPDGLDLLAEGFQRAGYATACFSTNVNAGPRQHLDRGFGDFFDHFAYYWSADSTRTVPIEEVAGWMQRHRDRPIFVYVHTAEPHSPYEAPPPFGDRYDPDYTGPITGSHTDKVHGFQQARSPRDVEHVVALYDGEVAYADHRFGLFMSRLAELGLDGGLITVVTSDHGEQFLEHGLWKHGGDVHGELIRVPLIMAGPEGLVPMRRVEQAVQLLDIWPTLLDFCGLQGPTKTYGDSLRPLMNGRGAERFAERAIFSSTFRPMPPHHALIRMPWKLMFKPERGDPRASFFLYNIADDPGEQHDRFDEEPEVAARLLRELVGTRAGYPRYAAGGGVSQWVQFDRQHIERLKALGYIQQDEPTRPDQPGAH